MDPAVARDGNDIGPVSSVPGDMTLVSGPGLELVGVEDSLVRDNGGRE